MSAAIPGIPETVYLFHELERLLARCTQRRHILRCSQPDRADVDLVVIVAQRVAEAAINVWRDIRGNGGHDFVADADGGFGDPGEAAFDRVEGHRAVSEIVVGEAFDVAPDPLGVFDDMFEPPPLAFDQHFRRQAPGPGRSRFASLASAQVRRPNR